MDFFRCIERIKNEEIRKLFVGLYGDCESIVEYQQKRYLKALNSFHELFPLDLEVKVYSAPGRTEIGGNHTDHQRGVVLGGAINLDVIAVVSFHEKGIIQVQSEGYNFTTINLDDVMPESTDDGTTLLIKGIVSKYREKGVHVKGFDMYATSDVLCGGGISSSAAFETLIGTVINNYYNQGKSSPFEIAQIGCFAENVFFGKKSGLLDQTVASHGGLVSVDFSKNVPEIEQIFFDFEAAGYAIFIIDTNSNHQNLTGEYDAINGEMKSVAGYFGKEVLNEIDKNDFYNSFPDIRQYCTDRALLRAAHFFDETKRAKDEAIALKDNKIESFLKLVNESGMSSATLLQNLYSTKVPTEQAIPLALTLSKEFLGGQGAIRVHGGGFAGTIQAFVPLTISDEFKEKIDRVYGPGACCRVRIRPFGGLEII